LLTVLLVTQGSINPKKEKHFVLNAFLDYIKTKKYKIYVNRAQEVNFKGIQMPVVVTM